MKIITLSPGTWGATCYILISGGEALVVDPSVPVETIKKHLAGEGARLVGIVLTHGHFDHALSLDELREAYGVPLMIHAEDDELLSDPEKNCSKMFYRSMTHKGADKLLAVGGVIKLGGEEIRVIHTPGHTKGSICLLAGGMLLTGDTLFADGFGRIDFYGGSLHNMKQSMLRLNELDPNLTIYPGHAESTTLGRALENIRFLNR